MCTGPVDIAAPKLSGFSSYLPASSTALTSSHLAHSGFLKFDHKGLPIHLEVLLVTQKWVLKTKKMCSEHRLTNPHYITQVKAGLRQCRLAWRLK